MRDCYITTINGETVLVRVIPAVRHRDSSLSLTKAKRQRNKGREAGGRYVAKERE
jgi:hypothetical protein